MSETSLLERTNTWVRKSITIKLFFIGVLILLLMIPSGMINSIIKERQQTQRATVSDVSSDWGDMQTIGGPVLTIPYLVYWKNAEGETIPDLGGIKEVVSLSFAGKEYPFDPGLQTADHFKSGISSRIEMTSDMIDDSGAEYKIDLNINGSSQLNFVPVGKITDVRITSPWNHPSSAGTPLPVYDKIPDGEGFAANWKVLHHNRNYPQQWTENKYSFRDSQFGVKFFMPVDHYQKSSRSAKYSIMFIGFTFLVYFFVEILNKKRIHPIQYLLVGFAICVFYLLLVSMSEHIPFITSYLIAATAIIVLITLYTRTIVKDWRLSGIMAGLLIILYVFLYVLLLQQDYALLLGSLGLFITLAVVMYITRKIDWYGDEAEDPLDPMPQLE